LSVSYDHRLIDGADAARFLRWIAEALEHPLALALGS
jgi:pyruvate dehydrogenase E2 component (dihydrolipoyllysine-residue acetyltransferase)